MSLGAGFSEGVDDNLENYYSENRNDEQHSENSSTIYNI